MRRVVIETVLMKRRLRHLVCLCHRDKLMVLIVLVLCKKSTIERWVVVLLLVGRVKLTKRRVIVFVLGLVVVERRFVVWETMSSLSLMDCKESTRERKQVKKLVVSFVSEFLRGFVFIFGYRFRIDKRMTVVNPSLSTKSLGSLAWFGCGANRESSGRSVPPSQAGRFGWRNPIRYCSIIIINLLFVIMYSLCRRRKASQGCSTPSSRTVIVHHAYYRFGLYLTCPIFINHTHTYDATRAPISTCRQSNGSLTQFDSLAFRQRKV